MFPWFDLINNNKHSHLTYFLSKKGHTRHGSRVIVSLARRFSLQEVERSRSFSKHRSTFTSFKRKMNKLFCMLFLPCNLKHKHILNYLESRPSLAASLHRWHNPTDWPADLNRKFYIKDNKQPAETDPHKTRDHGGGNGAQLADGCALNHPVIVLWCPHSKV